MCRIPPLPRVQEDCPWLAAAPTLLPVNGWKTRRPKGGQPPEPLARLTVPRSEFEAEIEARIAKGNELLSLPMAAEQEYDQTQRSYYTWDEFNADLMRRRFSTPRYAGEYEESLHLVMFTGASLSEKVEELRDDIRAKIRRLESVQERLPLIEEREGPGRRPDAKATSIFIVHGHDGTAKNRVARFLEGVTPLRVVILHEQPNRGRTIIEKFEGHAAEAAFAVVLLTADDEGGERGEKARKLRARQNVVFELGFFCGGMGRERVAVLQEEGVEQPSDIQGLVYIPLDERGAWKVALAKELKAAGIRIDLNKLA